MATVAISNWRLLRRVLSQELHQLPNRPPWFWAVQQHDAELAFDWTVIERHFPDCAKQ
jgi:hypothetical protein